MQNIHRPVENFCPLCLPVVIVEVMKISAKLIKKNGGVDVYERVQRANIEQVKNAMAEAIANRAKVLAPYDKKKGKDEIHLAYNGRVVRDGDSVATVFGDNKIQYARIHEMGGMTGRNHATPIKARHYLKQAGDSVMKEGAKKYWR